MTLFGQACLAARRLVEAGGRFVTVFWDGFGQFAGCAWDTHANHYPRLKEYLLPGLRPGVLRPDPRPGGARPARRDAGAVAERARPDAADRLEAEGGRPAPLVAGLLGGAGRRRVGPRAGGRSTDRIGGDVRDTPVSPKDVLATAFHLLGIDPHADGAGPAGQADAGGREWGGAAGADRLGSIRAAPRSGGGTGGFRRSRRSGVSGAGAGAHDNCLWDPLAAPLTPLHCAAAAAPPPLRSAPCAALIGPNRPNDPTDSSCCSSRG